MSVFPRLSHAPALKLLLSGGLAALAPACSSFAATAGAVTIGFDQVADGTFTHYVESGFSLDARRASGWMASTGYGNPAPFIAFNVPANTKTTAHLFITENGSSFTFTSVDFYASDNPISYTFKASLKGAVVYTGRGNTGQLYGQFRTFFNKKKNTKISIDSLEITMIDAQSIGDLAGLDNIVLGTSGTNAD